jgi:hypothetical protein
VFSDFFNLTIVIESFLKTKEKMSFVQYTVHNEHPFNDEGDDVSFIAVTDRQLLVLCYFVAL